MAKTFGFRKDQDTGFWFGLTCTENSTYNYAIEQGGFFHKIQGLIGKIKCARLESRVSSTKYFDSLQDFHDLATESGRHHEPGFLEIRCTRWCP